MKRAAVVFAAVVLVACGTSPTQTRSSAGSSARSNPITTSPASGARVTEPFTTNLYCVQQPIAGHALALFRNIYEQQTPLGVIDISNPLKPVLDCTLSPAQGGRFLSATKIAFWAGENLGTADLLTGAVTQTAKLPAVAGSGAFSADGSEFAYRVWDSAGGATGHLLVAGADRTLYKQDPIPGKDGPGPDFGPFDHIAFSADGSELMDYMLYRPYPGPSPLLVFKTDGPPLLESASVGLWSSSGSLPYVSVATPSITTEVDSVDSTGQRRTISTALNGYHWPTLAPDGASIVYSTQDRSIPECGGLPHLWRLELSTGRISQLSTPVSSTPVFIGPNTVWSDEEKQQQCGPGGPAGQDGVILAHDLTTNSDSPVDLSFYQALTGAAAPSWITTAWVLDTKF